MILFIFHNANHLAVLRVHTLRKALSTYTTLLIKSIPNSNAQFNKLIVSFMLHLHVVRTLRISTKSSHDR